VEKENKTINETSKILILKPKKDDFIKPPPGIIFSYYSTIYGYNYHAFSFSERKN
jgi:hypothetical protein